VLAGERDEGGCGGAEGASGGQTRTEVLLARGIVGWRSGGIGTPPHTRSTRKTACMLSRAERWRPSCCPLSGAALTRVALGLARLGDASRTLGLLPRLSLMAGSFE